MCKYEGPSATCAGATLFRKLSPEAEEALLAEHNRLRSRAAQGLDQAPAANMRKLSWSPELALISQRWADQCTFAHDAVRTLVDGTRVGQNVYYSGTTNELFLDAVQGSVDAATTAWYDEVTTPGFSDDDIQPFVFSFPAGHYTQVAWADTTEVGCGLAYYQDPADSWYKSLIVCNYAVAGNKRGGAMYAQGEACSQCPQGTQCDTQYQGLCA